MTKVLLIEDADQTEEIVAELVHRGFHVERAVTGTAGLENARAAKQDVIVVDRVLPEIGGLTIIETLRQDQVRTPVLVLSALGAVDDRVRGLRAGGDDYLAKPFALVELVARLEALLRRLVESRETTLRVGPLELDLICRGSSEVLSHYNCSLGQRGIEGVAQDRNAPPLADTLQASSDSSRRAGKALVSHRGPT